MIRFVLLLGSLLYAIGSFGQGLSLCQQVIGTTGSSATESGLHYTYTVGEPVIFTLKKQDVDVVLTQGFHQPDVCLPVSTDNPEQWAGWDIQAYPNPVTDYLTLQYTAPTDALVQAKVVNTMGQIVMGLRATQANGDQIQCTGWAAGMYFLVLFNPETNATVTIPFSKF